MPDRPAACGSDPKSCQLCDDGDCLMSLVGYIWCRPCEESHRPPECAIDEQGRSLRWCGHPWDEDCPC